MVQPDANVDEALEVMTACGISSAMVLPLPFSTEYGIITMRDVVGKVVTNDLTPAEVRVGDIVTWRPVTITLSTTAKDAAKLMAHMHVRRLPVAAEGDLIGIISDTDIFTALAPHKESESVRQVRGHC